MILLISSSVIRHLLVIYSFDTSDIEHFSSGIQNTFKKANIINLIDLYQYKYLDKAKGLKSMCNEILGINICKYEQCAF